MASDKKLSALDPAQAVAIADELLMTDDPAGTPASQRASVLQLAEAIDILTASGVLAVSDVLPILNGGSVKQGTVQKIFDAVELLSPASLFFAGDEYIPVYQSGAAVRTQLHEVMEFWNTATPSKVGWIEKWTVPDGDATPTSIGESWTFAGSANTAFAASATNPQGLNGATTAVANNRAYWGANALHWLRKELRLEMWVQIPDITNVSVQLGFYETSYGSITNVDTIGGATDWVGFRFSTGAGDTNFMYTYGTAGAGTFTSTGIAANTNVNLFEIRLRTNGRVDYYINTVRVGTNVNVTTNTSTNLLTLAGITTLSANVRNLRWFGHKVSQKWF